MIRIITDAVAAERIAAGEAAALRSELDALRPRGWRRWFRRYAGTRPV